MTRFDFSIFTAPRNEPPGQLRFAGAVLLVLGPVLIAGGAVFFWLQSGAHIPAEWLPQGMRIEDSAGDGLSPVQRAGIAAIALLFLTCGAATTLQGFWQLVLGRKNRVLLRIIVAVAVVLGVDGVAASLYTGCPIGRICQ
jgi:uncharacterized membrane protein YidH (DUF202 family)